MFYTGFQRPFKEGDIIVAATTNSIHILKHRSDVYRWSSYCRLGEEGEGNLRLQETTNINPHRFATEEEKQKLFDAIKAHGYKWNAETKTLEKLVEPIFKVGNKIEKCGYRFTIAEVKDDYYLTKCDNKIPIDNQDDFSLVPNKFDITTLNAFDKVLVRDSDKDMWRASIFSNTWKDRYFCVGAWHNQCIPYDVNKELLGTTDDCEDFYKTWE